jgi:hypothetical protein
MTTTKTLARTLEYGKGYAGKLGKRPYVARILGTDQQYGLRREFLDPVRVEREHFNRPRTMVHMTYELEVDGLYELSEAGERWFEMCYQKKDGSIKTAGLSDARLKAWLRAIDEGKTDREARLSTKGL